MYAQGTVIGGRYRLSRQIGEGGMAAVWEAEHLTLGSPVAVKFLQNPGGTEKTNERFMREARAAAAVRHRNVIEITDFGVTDDGIPYMVLELLEGQNLGDRIQTSAPLEPLEATRIVSLTLRGLAAVHDSGIVHRDLKPENIFLVADADGTFPKLLDFGVSRRVGGSSNTNLTQEGILVGTPDYMSPEQARGLRDIDRRTDIYSIGVILFEALTGRLPFESDNVGDLIVMITTQDPPTVREYRPEIPEKLAQVVAKAMARDRDARYQDARELRWALVEAMEELTVDRPSGLTSISDFPEKPPSTAQPARQPADTEPQAQGGPHAAVRSGALGGPPPAPASGRGRSSGRPWLLAAVALLAVAGAGAAAVAVYGPLREPAAKASKPEPKPEPWKPASAGLPPGLLDGGVRDAGARVHLQLQAVPEGGVVRVQGVPIQGTATKLPVADAPYTIEVRRPDAGVLWRTRHPPDVDAVYQVWEMTEEELTEAAPADAGARDGGADAGPRAEGPSGETEQPSASAKLPRRRR